MSIQLTSHESSMMRNQLIHALKLCEEENIDWERIRPANRMNVGSILKWGAEVLLSQSEFAALRDAIQDYVNELSRQDKSHLSSVMEQVRMEFITTYHYAQERAEG